MKLSKVDYVFLELFPSVLSAVWINYLLIDDEKRGRMVKNKEENTILNYLLGQALLCLPLYSSHIRINSWYLSGRC